MTAAPIPVIVERSSELISARWRGVIYAIGVTIFASFILFAQLGDSSLSADEARYALEVDHMLQTHNWLDPMPVIGSKPSFQKPPLYMWLTAATSRFLPYGELRYRFWSALFGIGAVMLTFGLAARFLSPEIALMAALALATNTKFLTEHGARVGAFDIGITLCYLSMISIAWMRRAPTMPAWKWIAIGVIAGLARLLKPLGGLVPLGVLGLTLTFDTRLSAVARVRGWLIALCICAVVGAPWYLVEYHRYGSAFVVEMFKSNLVTRITEGLDPRQVQKWYYYAAVVSGSSSLFWLFIPSAVLLALLAMRDRQRQTIAQLLLVCGIGWVVIFSVSKSKFLHYAYPAFPFIAIAIAAMLEWCARQLVRLRPDHPRARLGITIAAIVAVECWLGAQFIFGRVPRSITHYRPWDIYSSVAPAIDSGRVRFTWIGFPPTEAEWEWRMALQAGDVAYLERMRRAKQLTSLDDARQFIAERGPALIMVSRMNAVDAAVDRLLDPQRLDGRFCDEKRAYVTRAVDFDSLLNLQWTADRPCAGIVLVKPAATATTGSSVPFDGGFVVRIDPAVRDECWLSAVITLDRSSLDEQRAWFEAAVLPQHGVTQQTIRVALSDLLLTETMHLPAQVEAARWRQAGPLEISFSLKPLKEGKPLHGELRSLSLNVYPSISR